MGSGSVSPMHEAACGWVTCMPAVPLCHFFALHECRVVDGKPSPNYRIYSNAFQGGFVGGGGGTPNYSHAKVSPSDQK